MSLWGADWTWYSCILPLGLNLGLSKNLLIKQLMEIFLGVLDGDGYIEIGPQKQYNKNKDSKINPKSTIRIRIVLRLHKNDKELLILFMNMFGIGRLDELKSVNQYRLIIFKKDIVDFIYPFLINNNLEFLSYNRRKQFFLLRYILENNITHWEDIDLQEIDKLFKKFNKQLDFSEIVKLPYFNEWLTGFTIAEGSFHIKSTGKAHYSIVQSGHENYHLIKAIHYFIKGPLSFDHQINPENSIVYRASFSSKKDLIVILNFFENNQLLGLKKLQFDKWRLYINNNYNLNSSASNVLLSKVSNNEEFNNSDTDNNNESS